MIVVGRVKTFERELCRLLKKVLGEDLVGDHPCGFCEVVYRFADILGPHSADLRRPPLLNLVELGHHFH